VSDAILVDADGWTLHLHPHEAAEPWASAVLVHAMMVDASTLASLGDQLARAGIRCWRVDLRGHGASTPHARDADWSFDDLVDKDYPAVLRWVRDHGDDHPVWLVGHSLGGLVGIAHQGRHSRGFDGIVAISSGVWGFERGWLLHWMRRTLLNVAAVIVRVVGRLPARWWGNPTDEAATYWGQLVHWTRHRCWAAADGFDYHRGAAAIDVPCIGIRGTRDRLVVASDHAELLCMPQAEFRTVAGRGHMSATKDAAETIIEVIRHHTAP
jgi:predicted alpha/beta hydrolase